MDQRAHHLGRRGKGAAMHLHRQLRGGTAPLGKDRQPAIGAATRPGDDPLSHFELEHQRERAPLRRPVPRRKASRRTMRCRHYRANWRPPKSAPRQTGLRDRFSSRRLRSRAAGRERRRRARPGRGGSARSISIAVTCAPARSSARVRPPGPGPTSSTAWSARWPGIAAIRSSNCSSRRKFWPSALDALRPWRAITSRRGGRLIEPRGGAAAHSPAMRIAAMVAPGSAMLLSGDAEGGAVIGRGADDRQAERDVDPGIEIERFQRESAPDRDTCTAPRHKSSRCARREQRIGRVRAGRVDPSGCAIVRQPGR